MLEELSSLARDLLLRKTAPQGGAALLTGGYDGNTMRSLGEQFTAPRLLQILKLLQSTLPELARSSSRRTDAELCLIRLCDERCASSACATSGWTTPPQGWPPGLPGWRSCWPEGFRPRQ